MMIRNFVIFWLSKIILNLVSPENKAIFRKLENLEKKKIGTQMNRELNQIYLYTYAYKLLPSWKQIYSNK